MMALFVAKLRGAGEIIMLGTRHDKRRLAVAAAIGATHTLDIDESDPLELVRELGDGFGADLVVDCSGVSIALKTGAGAGSPEWHHHKNRLGSAAARLQPRPAGAESDYAARQFQPPA